MIDLPITTDEVLILNGTTVTATALAEARQALAHEGTGYVPPWDGLSPDEQQQATWDAAGWLRSLTRIVTARTVDYDRARDALDELAKVVHPCPPPNTADGKCPCGKGHTWPCPRTRAVWTARGINPYEEIKAAGDKMRGPLLAEAGE